MNITQKSQYISANSGGTWVAVPYAYTNAPMSRFFSPYFEPHNLTTSRLSMSLTPGSWGSRVAGKTLLLGAIGNPSKWIVVAAVAAAAAARAQSGEVNYWMPTQQCHWQLIIGSRAAAGGRIYQNNPVLW